MKFFKIIEKSEKYLAVSKKMSNFAGETNSHCKYDGKRKDASWHDL